MSVRIIPWKPDRLTNKWMADIRYRTPDGAKARDRTIFDAPTKAQARRLAQERERLLISGALVPAQPEVSTVAAFAPDYVATMTANGKKRSAIKAAQSILDIHVLPFVGDKPLDKITNDVVDGLKAKWKAGGYLIPTGAKKGRKVGPASNKSINNRLIALRALLRRAVKHKAKTGLEEVPCVFELLPVDDGKPPEFYEHETYERIVDAAAKVSPQALAVVLLGGDAGLRLGEMLALNLTDIEFKTGKIMVQRSVFHEDEEDVYEDTVKGGVTAPVPMTPRLTEAVRALRHLRGERLFYADDGAQMTPKALRVLVGRVERLAGLPKTMRVHIFRHTYCSHLAMAGVPVMTIKELARHADISTTMRYMHLSPSAKDVGVEMLVKSRAAGGVPVAYEATR